MESDRQDIRGRVAVLGDLHGHLQLGLCAVARARRERGTPLDAVLLAGDVGTFTEDAQLDSATRSHARDNPCELEFMTQWARPGPPLWLDRIFRPEPEGLGLTCPVIMVHGNHEGFAHLANLFSRRRRPRMPCRPDELPGVDTGGHVKLLPPGWVVKVGGLTVGGIGGMEAGQRRARYHPMAYVDEDAVGELAHGREVDILLTHQGPAAVQGGHGSPTLDALVGRGRFWFHGHSTPVTEPTEVGGTVVVPLGDLAFSGRGSRREDPGLAGWSVLGVRSDGSHGLDREPPAFWRELRRKFWHVTPEGWWVCPELIPYLRSG